MVNVKVRMTKAEWQQAKLFAANEGLSLNAYIKKLLMDKTTKTFLGAGNHNLKRSKRLESVGKMTIWDLPKLATKWSRKPADLSEEDKIIYDI